MKKQHTSQDLYDKTGRKIEVGDTLKVFHFIGPRRKRYYMYKFVLERKQITDGESEWLAISHLSYKGIEKCYYEMCDGRHLDHVEIVQGYKGGTSHEDRPRVKKLEAEA